MAAVSQITSARASSKLEHGYGLIPSDPRGPVAVVAARPVFAMPLPALAFMGLLALAAWRRGAVCR
jgi:hypothetical protein